MAKPKPKPKPTKPRPYVKAKSPDVTGPEAHQFKPGESGNPLGRPLGARVVFGQAFVKQFAAYWEEVGQAALAELYRKDKRAFVGVAVGLLPKLIDVSGEIDHRVYERIPWNEIIKRAEQYPEPRGSESRPRLDS